MSPALARKEDSCIKIKPPGSGSVWSRGAVLPYNYSAALRTLLTGSS